MVRLHIFLMVLPLIRVTGNLRQILNKNGWNFIQDLTDNYPGIAKLNGPLGVRPKHR